MTITVCDVCGKKMSSTHKSHTNFKDFNFCISSNGRIWDICNDCQGSLNMWITARNAKMVNNKENLKDCRK